jgi:hypothetical protein
LVPWFGLWVCDELVKGVVGAGAGAALFRGLPTFLPSYCIAACVLMADMVIGIGLSMVQHHITKLAITVKTKHRGGQN